MARLIRLILLAVLAVTSSAAATAARADTLTFWMASDHEYTVRVEFSSSKSRYWPGNGLSYSIDDYENHKFVLNCRTGEKICYGAWEEGGDVRWGLGYQRDRSCTNCCYTCNGNTETRLITLTD